jgi:RecA/RadA recombinase
MVPDRLATGIASVDRLLGGGLETDSVTEVYGEGGSGKTLFCLEVAQRVAREADGSSMSTRRG